MRPITDHAEVAIEFPDKAYMGGFGHAAAFTAYAAPDKVEIKLSSSAGPKRAVDIHLHWFMFADLIDEIAASLEGRNLPASPAHREALAHAIDRLGAALRPQTDSPPS